MLNSSKVGLYGDATRVRVGTTVSSSQYINVVTESSLGNFNLHLDNDALKIWDSAQQKNICILPWALNNKTVYTSFYSKSSKITIRNVQIVKYYNFVAVTTQFDITSDLANGDVMFTLPTGCPGSILNMHYVAGSSSGSFGYRIDSSRNIVAESSPSVPKTGNWAGISAVYPIR